MVDLDLPTSLERFRSKLEPTIKSYIDIQTRFTREATLWQSKFAGFPYLPKNLEYPTTPEGEYLYLLAQINFDEVPHLAGFPTTGILQFYIAKDGMYGLDFENPTRQSKFRVLYFPELDLNENNLVTDFDFLPTLWDYDKDLIPFYVFSSYTPHRNDCFTLSFTLKAAPISSCDYQFEKLIGNEIWDVFQANNRALYNEYQERFVSGHRLGGYPNFTQDDFRKNLPENEEPYVLLFQIDFDPGELEKISIEWGDIGVGNFWIKASALKNLDFSGVLYNWDC
ncbi:hypothetical protein Syn7502_00399 [Synechococcus sp. PCC 7502]|uniref:YwqG family protein n=1 Tax=Synechococcus sp. PCC 7502 TaxID=1173263 RepID=UPI00029FDC4A|nr:YwqG family protein [Synechococcus sp. PCC 7502]AFY72563.1 hypothetical protein Syn7502_00399 [Synechococcus sp. PCC 7502]